MQQSDVAEASKKLPLRGMKCTHYYKRTDERDADGGRIFKGFYRVELRMCKGGPDKEDFEKFEDIGHVNFRSHEQAISFCLSRMVGRIDRTLPRSVRSPFTPEEGDDMWSFDLEEYISGRYIGEEWCSDPEWSISKSCRSEIKARYAVGKEQARYTGIGHMGVLGIAHIVDTISRDHHFGNERRADIAMFEYRDRMYRPTHFDNDKPWVSGQMIEGRGSVNHVNYHSNFVSFHRFGTVVKMLGKYYLDGALVHGGKSGDCMWMKDDEVLGWIADNYPNADYYKGDMECGSLNYIRKRRGSTDDSRSDS